MASERWHERNRLWQALSSPQGDSNQELIEEYLELMRSER
jgi:hypothetical protein